MKEDSQIFGFTWPGVFAFGIDFGWPWYWEEGDMRFTHLASLMTVAREGKSRGLQLIIGPLMFSLAIPKGRK